MRLIQQAVLYLFFLAILPLSPFCQQATNHGIVRGVVMLKDTGAPAAGTVVSLRQTSVGPIPIQGTGEYLYRPQERDLNAIVNRSGTFRIDEVPRGDYVLMTYKPGYFDSDAIAANGFMQVVHLAAGETKKVNIHLERGGTIKGQVRFDNGAPAHTGRQVVDEVAVNAEIETPSGRLSRFGGAAHTDAEGRYSIGGLPPGTYLVFAGMPGKMVAVKGGGELGSGGRIVFAPRGIRASNAERVEVHPPGVVSGVNIVIQTQALHTISGRIIDRNGDPVTEGLIWLYPAGQSVLGRSSPPGAKGEFSFEDLPNENYTVEYKSYPQQKVLGVTADRTGIRMRITKAPYAPAAKQVRIIGRDINNVVLRVHPAS